MNVARGVILAAGDGDRLAPLTLDRPKPLVPVLGKPMIEYTLESFARNGVKDVVIVTGYKGDLLRRHIGDGSRFGLRVRFVHNPDFEKGNAVSLNAAREAVKGGPFVLAMSDHLVSTELLSKALDAADGRCSLCVDFKPLPIIVDEATKVQVDGDGRILRIGKDVRDWDGVDTGVFVLTPEVFEAIEAVLAQKGDCELSDAMTWLINHGSGLFACDVTGSFWMDVDTLQDLQFAEKRLKKEVFNARDLIRGDGLEAPEQKVLKTHRPIAGPHAGYAQSGKLFELPDRTWGRHSLYSG